MQLVTITSKNPVKIEATREAFDKMFPNLEFEFTGVTAASNVSDQPMSEAETQQGALNRIQNAKKTQSSDFFVSIESGLEEIDGHMSCFVWVVTESQDRIGKSRSATFFLPERVAELVKGGMELGDADDIVFGQSNSKQANGATGLLTGDVITRTSSITESICLALIPFKNPELY